MAQVKIKSTVTTLHTILFIVLHNWRSLSAQLIWVMVESTACGPSLSWQFMGVWRGLVLCCEFCLLVCFGCCLWCSQRLAGQRLSCVWGKPIWACVHADDWFTPSSTLCRPLKCSTALFPMNVSLHLDASNEGHQNTSDPYDPLLHLMLYTSLARVLPMLTPGNQLFKEVIRTQPRAHSVLGIKGGPKDTEV